MEISLTGGSMPIPEWNEYGLLPEGIHDCAIEDIQLRLGFNEHRQRLLEGLDGAIQWLKTMPPIECLIIDGSFVTDKERPGDIDAVAMIANLTEKNQREWVRSWESQKVMIKQNHQVDLYPTVLGNGYNFAAFFQYIRPEEALERGAPLGLLKGIVRMAQ